MTFDPATFKATTRAQWETAADAWHRWGPFLGEWRCAARRVCSPAGCDIQDPGAGTAAGEVEPLSSSTPRRNRGWPARGPSPARGRTARRAAECVAFERESFGALHQMMATLSDGERTDTWAEIEHELRRFETPQGFVGPCELLINAGAK